MVRLKVILARPFLGSLDIFQFHDGSIKGATPGRYHAYYYWEGGGGHIITVERLQDGQLRLYDPLIGKLYDDAKWRFYTTRMVLRHGISVYKADGFLINNDIISGVVRRSL